MKIGDYIKAAREELGFSPADLARKSTLAPGEISLLESGKRTRPTPDTIMKLARALRKKPDEFYQVLASRDYILRDAPPKGLQDLSLRELQTNIIEVPVVAELHMPGEIVEYAYISRPRPGQVNFVGVRAKGYCLEPEIKDGDILIIDKDTVPEAGHTILCYHNGSQHPRLIKYKQPADLKDCDIYGVVIGINRRL
jgi:transcriptional regulator with XRE-family HTH domain